MSKKKKHIQTEKERLHQEEAARLRAEKAAAAKKRERKDRLFLLLIACVLFALSIGFTVWTVARMHNFETNYVSMKGTITGYETRHGGVGKYRTGRRYTLIISYSYEGQSYSFSDSVSYLARPDDMVGEKTEIYVNPQNPSQAKRVSTASTPSFVSVVAFPFGAVFYAFGMALVLQEREKLSCSNRFLYIWLPLFCCCVATVLLFWVALPHDGFGAVFSRIEGAICFTVIAGLIVAVALLDWLLSKRRKR